MPLGNSLQQWSIKEQEHGIYGIQSHMLYETGADKPFLRLVVGSRSSSSLESFLASLRVNKQTLHQRWGMMDCDVLCNDSFEILSSAHATGLKKEV